MSPARPNIFRIPGSHRFLDSLANACLGGGFPGLTQPAPPPQDLSQWTLLVPTRRAARALEDAFFAHTTSQACLLPRIKPLGDVDEDETLLTPAGFDATAIDLPRPASTLERQFLLAQLINKWAEVTSENRLALAISNTPAQLFALAQSLAELIDSFDSEDVALVAIMDLFDDRELPAHREAALDFLAIVNQHLPSLMAERNSAGPIDIRNRLIRAQAERLHHTPPEFPIIAAGSTGSIPATAALLNVIANLPNGAVVLPGLDVAMDEQSWDQLAPSHPQFGMRELLAGMGVEREDVALLPGLTDDASRHARSWLISEIMRPAETTALWQTALNHNCDKLRQATQNIHQITAPDQRHEALAIALIMRHTLEQENSSTALITPDRRLARRVRAELARWDITIDDSAGQPLNLHRPGAFMQLLLNMVLESFAPPALMALLAHPFTKLGLSRLQLSHAARVLETGVLRGPTDWHDLASLKATCERAEEKAQSDNYAHPLIKAHKATDWQAMRDIITSLHHICEPLAAAHKNNEKMPLAEIVQIHLNAAEALAAGCDDEQPTTGQPLWRGAAGEVNAALFSSLAEHADLCPDLRLADYAVLLSSLMARAAVRPPHANQPRLMVLGLMEARLSRADTMILAGLNEGTWPGEAEIDPWLNRPQRDQLGLQSPERRIGLSAHDFAQGLGADKVYLTSSAKIDGTPKVQSRWLLRLNALLNAAGVDDVLTPDQPWLDWVELLEQTGPPHPARQPMPTPPVSARPINFSITEVDTLLRDPYTIYAKKILKLQALPTLGYNPSYLERGNLVHEALENFCRDHPGPLAETAIEQLMAAFNTSLNAAIPDDALKAMWQPQLHRMADWFIKHEYDLRDNLSDQKLESLGSYEFVLNDTQYRLRGKADRIDILNNGSVRIIDYKTGTVPAVTPDKQGFNYQLTLEAWLALQGAFPGLDKLPTSELAYMRLTGGEPAGEYKTIKGDPVALAQDHFDGFCQLLEKFTHHTHPYLAPYRPEREDRERDYDHLSRWREWGLRQETVDGQ